MTRSERGSGKVKVCEAMACTLQKVIGLIGQAAGRSNELAPVTATCVFLKLLASKRGLLLYGTHVCHQRPVALAA